MSQSVFISYARKSSRPQAEALYRALGGEDGLAFLDTSNIESGERFPPVLVDALLASQVVVVFASEEYFQRRYCLWELDAALGGAASFGPGAMSAAKEPMLASIIVARPRQGSTPLELLPLPAYLREGDWPGADDTKTLEMRVREQLTGNPRTLAERLNAAGRSSALLRTQWLEQIALPPPKDLATVRAYPPALPSSLGNSFVGRADDLWRIHYALSVLRDERGTGATGAALTEALQGAAGAGKTRLALEYLYRFGPSHYCGGVFWVDADVGPERLEEQFHGILRTLRPEVPEWVELHESRQDVAREMAEALEAIAARERVLFVVDNVPEPGPGEPPKLLGTWCPAIGKVSLLATSRARLDIGTEGVHALPVLELAPEAAVALLREGLGRERLDDVGWRRLTEWVGCLPLALELLNQTLRTGTLTPEQLLSRAEQQEPAGNLEGQMDVLRRYLPADALAGVNEAFSISYARLSEAEKRAARLIAHLAPVPIPLDLLEAFGPDVMPDGVRATLLSRHVVMPPETTSEVRMFGRMHWLLADYLRNLAPDSLTELRQACRALRELMTPSACRNPRAWPLLNACLPHAEHAFGRLLEAGGSPRPTGVVGWLRRRFEASPGALDEFSLGADYLATLKTMGNLASALRARGDRVRARALEQQAREAKRRL